MKLLILAPYTVGSTFSGGAERHTKYIINELKSYDDLEIHVISITKEIKNDNVLKTGGVTIHQIKSVNLPMTVAGITLYPIKILKTVKKIKPDLIHGQMIGAPYGFATGLLSKKYPALLTVHTIIQQTAKTNRSLFGVMHDVLWRFLEKWELKIIPYLIVVSPHLKEDLEKDGAMNVSIIPNGIGASWFDILDKSVAGRILFVGRIRAGKGIDNLIKSMKLVINTGCDTHLHIVGPIDDRHHLKYLQELTKQMGIAEYIEFIGSIPDDALLNEYAECSVFVLPSSVESHPIVLLEAMASGTTVVATNVGGIPYMIEDGQTGFLLDYGDIEGLAEKILMLINDKNIRDRVAENGKKAAIECSWEAVSEETYKLYKHVYDTWDRAR